jgi:hypothetical protein
MSPGVNANAVKGSISVLLVMMVLAAAYALSQAQDKELYGATRYRVVRVPANIVDTEYTSEGRTRKPTMRPIHPLDELSAEGWELVTVVQADSVQVRVQPGTEAHGGDLICFLKKRESSSSPGRR